jgi:hypothetical protein
MRYFAIEGIAYRMTENNYMKLCKLYPYKGLGGKIILGSFDTNKGYYERSGRFDERPDYHVNCLTWIIEHSEELYQINVLNY